MEEKLEKYINTELKYYQDMFISMYENIQGLKPNSKKSFVLVSTVAREMTGYLYKALECKNMATSLGVEPIMNSKFEDILEKNNFSEIIENNFILNSKNELATDEDKTFKEYYEYLNSMQDVIEENQKKGK